VVRKKEVENKVLIDRYVHQGGLRKENVLVLVIEGGETVGGRGRVS